MHISSQEELLGVLCVCVYIYIFVDPSTLCAFRHVSHSLIKKHQDVLLELAFSTYVLLIFGLCYMLFFC